MALRKFLPLAALLAGGCAVGPDYESVEPDLPEVFTHAEGLGDADSTPIKGG